MKAARQAIALVTMLVLALGYGASQYAYMQGADSAVAYAQKVDSRPVAMTALVLLIATVALAFLPHDSDPERPEPPTT